MVFCLVQILSIIVLSKEESDLDLDKLSLTPYWFLTCDKIWKLKAWKLQVFENLLRISGALLSTTPPPPHIWRPQRHNFHVNA